MLTRITMLTLLFAPAYVAGCNSGRTAQPDQMAAADTTSKSTQKVESEDHGHVPGAHGGIIVPIGRDNYHAEAVFEQGGVLKLFTLGKDETKVIDVESQSLTAYVKPAGSTRAISVALKPESQPGDAPGKTSQFAGTLPVELESQALEVTIPSIRIAGERYRVAFASALANEHDAMPGKVADEEEQSLYLTPGGKYTQADIEANGRMTASQKFRGFRAEHDMHPKAGDTICPVTFTKANPKCSWVVAGNKYEFCCPPCVDEFVKLAKEDPNKLKNPDEYIKR